MTTDFFFDAVDSAKVDPGGDYMIVMAVPGSTYVRAFVEPKDRDSLIFFRDAITTILNGMINEQPPQQDGPSLT